MRCKPFLEGTETLRIFAVQFHAVVGLALCDCSFWIKMEDIEYLRIQPEEEQEALDFFYSVFVADEGQLSSMGAGRHPEVTEDMLRMLRQGVSLAARDVTSGKMVGQLIMEIFSRKECMSWDKDPPSYSTMLDKYGDEPWARFGHVGGKILWPRDLFTDSPSLETIMDLGFLSVEKEWRGRGIAGELMRRGEALAREVKCQGTVVIASTTATVRITKRLEMKVLHECRWEDYCDDNGNQIFNLPAEKGDSIKSLIKLF